MGVVGSVGSGKSSLISAMLGEMECCEGKCTVYTEKIVSYFCVCVCSIVLFCFCLEKIIHNKQ